MAEDPTPLGKPPKTLTRAQVLAKLKRVDKPIMIDGLGLLQGRSVSVEDMAAIHGNITNGDGGDIDPILLTTHMIAKTFPVFEDEDVAVLRSGNPTAYMALANATIELNPHIFNRKDGSANLPLSFRKDAGTRKRVQRRKRAGS
jgi:hypothetical protein